jgi:DNA-binding MarR family transcriptional regulator
MATRASKAEGGARHKDLSAALDGMRRIVRALGVSSRTAERTVGITGAQLLVLMQLDDAPARSLNDLAQRTFTHQSTVSVVVDRLVARRFVKRERSHDDGRKILLSLTAAGRAALRKAPPPAQTKLIAALTALPPRHLKALATALTATVSEMGLADHPAGMFFDDSTKPRRRRS